MPSFSRLTTLTLTLLATNCQPNTQSSAKSDAGVAPSTGVAPLGSIAPTKALDEVSCRSVANTAIPTNDEPNADEMREFHACDSEALYYGIEQSTDFVKARKCAYVERASKRPPPLGGATTLMMIYANGKGVAPNFDLAQRFACEMVSSSVELDARMALLNQAKQTGKLLSPLEVCDYAHLTSGFSIGLCAAHDARLQSGARAARRAKALNSLSDRETLAFENVAKAFFDARIQGELNLSGTMSDAIAINERSRLNTELTAALEKPGCGDKQSVEDLEAIERELNDVYREVMTCFETREAKGQPLLPGSPTSKGIRNAERFWLPYREALTQVLVRLRPQNTLDQCKAWLARKRIEMLRALRKDCY